MQNNYIEIEANNDKSLNVLLRELQSIKLRDYLDFNWSLDPNVNFENFMNISTQAKQRCMPKKRVKDESTWMTRGILNSLNLKIKLYKNNLRIRIRITLFRKI